jgi:hypothetical protein
MPAGFLLIRRMPSGKIDAYREQTFPTLHHAAAAARGALIGAGLAGTARARLFADALARRPLATIWGHPSGWDFRILAADFTEDAAPITPGARLFNYYDRQWGTVLPDQFMAEGLLYPGGNAFDHWYDFARESDGHIAKFNGQRLASREL